MALILSREAKQDEWTIGAAILDKDEPRRVLNILDFPLLRPERIYETVGNVPNVVFPSGVLVRNEDLLVYYGAADKVICLAKINLSLLLRELLR